VQSDELFTEDSNDSTTRKRRKVAEKSKSKVGRRSKKNDCVNAELEDEDSNEITSLSQQTGEMRLNNNVNNELNDSTFEYYDQMNSCFSNKSNRSSLSTQCQNSSKSQQYTQLNKINQSDKSQQSFLDTLSSIIETPKKPFSFPPMPKSANKKQRKKSTAKDDLIVKKLPVQRNLNIFPEDSQKISIKTPNKVSSSKVSSSKVSSSKVSSSKASTSKTPCSSKTPSSTTTTKPRGRPRTTSVSSYKSLNEEEEEEKVIDKAQRRKEQNRLSAQQYRQREKQKVEEMDRRLVELRTEYNNKRRLLRETLVAKHHLIVGMLQNLDKNDVPDWMLNPDLQLLI